MEYSNVILLLTLGFFQQENVQWLLVAPHKTLNWYLSEFGTKNCSVIYQFILSLRQWLTVFLHSVFRVYVFEVWCDIMTMMAYYTTKRCIVDIKVRMKVLSKEALGVKGHEGKVWPDNVLSPINHRSYRFITKSWSQTFLIHWVSNRFWHDDHINRISLRKHTDTQCFQNIFQGADSYYFTIFLHTLLLSSFSFLSQAH